MAWVRNTGPQDARSRLPAFVAAAALLAFGLPANAPAASINVTTTTDEVSDNATCSLREAITAANTDSNAHEDACGATGAFGADTVNLQPGAYAVLQLGEEDANAAGDFDIAPGPGFTLRGVGGMPTISGSDADRVLHVLGGGTGPVTVESVRIAGGRTLSELGGGGILSRSPDLRLRDSVVEGNEALGDAHGGGGVRIRPPSLPELSGTSEIENTLIEGNATVGIGGGLDAVGQLQVEVRDSTIAENTALAGGGASLAGVLDGVSVLI